MKTRTKVVSPRSGNSDGWAVMTTLIGGFLIWGFLGWLGDRLLGTSFLAPVGLIAGMCLGIYAVVARFGKAPELNDSQAPTKTSLTDPGAWRYAQLARKNVANSESSTTSVQRDSA
ncbi:hypothetical protein EH165_08400 [Nakamurella antarctica]|uniref:AtpZ/AtpI family protein n=1 Tax=Nakamurella antarctica TaxID=1902245 RepID=A0A3G8ZLX9_9ACTN|nr:hypothetical protein [Nakamurella antarctica]AZI58158.1 hypothetical protein EH165_08400 [Nakamurella antarctica]